MLRRLLESVRRKPAPIVLEPSGEALDYIVAAFAAKAAIQGAHGKVRLDQAAHVLRAATARAQFLTGQDWRQVALYRDQAGEACPSVNALHDLFNARFRAYSRPFRGQGATA